MHLQIHAQEAKRNQLHQWRKDVVRRQVRQRWSVKRRHNLVNQRHHKQEIDGHTNRKCALGFWVPAAVGLGRAQEHEGKEEQAHGADLAADQTDPLLVGRVVRRGEYGADNNTSNHGEHEQASAVDQGSLETAALVPGVVAQCGQDGVVESGQEEEDEDGADGDKDHLRDQDGDVVGVGGLDICGRGDVFVHDGEVGPEDVGDDADGAEEEDEGVDPPA